MLCGTRWVLTRASTALVLILCVGDAVAQADAPVTPKLRIGDTELVLRASPRWAADSAGAVQATWKETLHKPGATFVRAHFSENTTGPVDAILTITDAAGTVVKTYSVGEAAGRWTPFIEGDSATVELLAGGSGSERYIEIDEVSWGTYPLFADYSPATAGYYDICNASEPYRIRAADPVALIIWTDDCGGSYQCTSWLFSPHGHLMTNAHCANSQSEANNMEVWFNYVPYACDLPTEPNPDIYDDDITWVSTFCGLDSALFVVSDPVKGNPADVYGYLNIERSLPPLGQELWLPQHPGGTRKQISESCYVTDRSEPGVDFCADPGYPPNGCNNQGTWVGAVDLAFDCDIANGSSGSPVLNTSDKVVAIAHAEDVYGNGYGVRMYNIFPQLPIIPMQLVVSGPSMIDEGGSTALAATVYYLQGTNANVTSQAEWSVDPPSAGTVAPDGTFTAALVDGDTEATIWSSYTEGEFTVVGQLAITVVDLVPVVAPVAEDPPIQKNRYISLQAQSGGQLTALRVTLVDLPVSFESFEGQQLWVGAPADVTENPGHTSTTAGWPSFKAATLQCTPQCADFGAVGLLHVTGDAVVPGASYDVQAIKCSSDFGDEGSYSAALSVTTSAWGDMVGPFAGGAWPPPDGSAGTTTDVAALLDKFRAMPSAPMKVRCDLEPNVTDSTVNITDAARALDAAQGLPYPFDGPGGCLREALLQDDHNGGVALPIPGEIALVPVSSTGDFSIVGNDILIAAGGVSVTFEVRVSAWGPSPLRSYQAQVDSAGFAGGGVGSLSLTRIPCTSDSECDAWGGGVCLTDHGFCVESPSAYIDSTDPEYVFYGVGVYSPVDISTDDVRFASTLLAPADSMSDTGSVRYAGKLVLEVSADAGGIFTIGFTADGSLLADENNVLIEPLTLTPARIVIVQPPQPEDPPMAKNRHLSLVPQNPGQQTALRVTLTTAPAPFQGYEGCQLWVGGPSDVSEISGKDDATPPTFKRSTLQNAPYCLDWGVVGLLHVTDDEVLPGATYDVQAISCASDPANENNYSATLAVGTSKWGDMVGTNNSQPPDGVVDFNDIAAVVDKFKNLPGAPVKARADVAPDTLDRIVDFADIPAIVDAFRGRPYPYDGPSNCPPP